MGGGGGGGEIAAWNAADLVHRGLASAAAATGEEEAVARGGGWRALPRAPATADGRA